MSMTEPATLALVIGYIKTQHREAWENDTGWHVFWDCEVFSSKGKANKKAIALSSTHIEPLRLDDSYIRCIEGMVF